MPKTKKSKKPVLLEFIRARNEGIRLCNADLVARGEPTLNKCSYPDCDEFVDATPGMGGDTSCPYHRLLFDWWGMELGGCERQYKSRAGRRSAFTQWCRRMGKAKCDKIVDEMSRENINWEC